MIKVIILMIFDLLTSVVRTKPENKTTSIIGACIIAPFTIMSDKNIIFVVVVVVVDLVICYCGVAINKFRHGAKKN